MADIINRTEERVHIDNIEPHPANPNDGDVAAIAESIRQNGFYGRIVVRDSTGKILAGEHRWRAAQEVGLGEVPIERVECDDETAMRILLADNRTAEKAEREPEPLADLLKELEQTEDGLDGTGYMGDDLDELLDDLGRIPGDDVDDPGADTSRAEELQEEWGTELGQVWEVEKSRTHYICCADSLKSGVALCPKSSTANFVLTDPPYDLSASEVVEATSRIAPRWCAMMSDKLAFKMSRFAEVQFDLVWYTPSSPRSPGPVKAPIWYHRHCLFMTQGRDTKLRWERPRKDFGSVIDTEQAYIDSPHGQAKTPKVFEVLLSCVPSWDVVSDPFLGSGGTLIAAERSNRRLYGAELDPAMLAVCLQRCKGAGFTVSQL